MAIHRAKVRFVQFHLVVLAAVASPDAGRATDREWINPNGGYFSLGSNWAEGSAPGSGDRAIFSLDGQYTVRFRGDITNDRLRIGNDTMTLSLLGRTYRLTSTSSTSLSIGGSAVVDPGTPLLDGSLTILGGTLSSQSATIGAGRWGSGQATVSTGAVWNNAGVLNVGTGSAGDLVVQSGGDVTALSSVIGGFVNGNATVSGAGSTWSLGGSLDVNQGSLAVQDGGAVSNTVATIGTEAGKTAAATVTGAGSTWTGHGLLSVGLYGTGTLNVQAGGLVDTDNVSGDTIIADQDNSVGTVNIDGLDARWRNRGLRVGHMGSATVSVTNGGVLTCNGNTTIGHHPLGSGSVTVEGTGSAWHNGAGIIAVGGSTVATGGPGTLTIGPGGEVDTGYSSGLRLWGPGTLNLTGGSLTVGGFTHSGGVFNWTEGTLALTSTPTLLIGPGGPLGSNRTLGAGSSLRLQQYDNTLTIGYNGPGSLTLQDGASLEGGNVIVSGYNSTGSMTLDGTDAEANLNGLLVVGGYGAGTLSIQNSASVVNRTDSTGFRCGILGSQPGSTGTVNVDGAGSLWDASAYLQASANLVIGDFGHGVLNITNGGGVQNDYAFCTLGEAPGSHGEAVVSGDGSQWAIGRGLEIGYRGTGSILIADGAELTNQGTQIAQVTGSSGDVTVDGVGSTWTPMLLVVGGEGDATLTVRNGGVVQAGDTFLADRAGSTTTVDVEGAGSSLTAAGFYGQLIVGGASAASVNIRGGASVNARETFIGDGFTGDGSVVVSGVGSSLTSAEEIAMGYAAGSIGSLTIQDGATAATAFGRVGFNAGSTGAAEVSGAGSRWNISNQLDVGGGASGWLTISTGGVVHVANAATIQSSGAVALAGGTLEAASVDLSGGTLRGSGATAANLRNAGMVAPGASAGILNVTGTYSQETDGLLAIELGGIAVGTQYDRLAVSGSAMLGGTLELSLINGYVPAGGATFTILTAANISGTFADVVLVDWPDDVDATVSYTANSVIVRITSASSAGDMNCDGAFNPADAAPFALALTRPAAYQAAHPTCDINRADMNADGRINGADVQSFMARLLMP